VLKISIFHLSSVPEACLPDKHILPFCGKGVNQLLALGLQLLAQKRARQDLLLLFCIRKIVITLNP
jgi:hypothetical protein